MFERTSADQFHRDIVSAAVARDVVNSYDVRVVEGGGSLRFLDEALLARGVGERIVWKELKCDGTVQMAVLRFVHNTHSAFAQLTCDGVVGQLLSCQTPLLIYAVYLSKSRQAASRAVARW